MRYCQDPDRIGGALHDDLVKRTADGANLAPIAVRRSPQAAHADPWSQPVSQPGSLPFP